MQSVTGKGGSLPDASGGKRGLIFATFSNCHFYTIFLRKIFKKMARIWATLFLFLLRNFFTINLMRVAELTKLYI